MTGAKKKLEGQSGSAVRHIVVLLALVMACYLGVKAFYNRVDSSVSDRPVQPLQPAASETLETGRKSIDENGIDKEAITRRNLFLSGQREGDGGLAAALLDGADEAQAGLLLVGTIVETDGVNRAVVLDVEQKKQHLLKEGDMINGASVRRIDSGKVVISRQGRNELLDIAEAEKLRAATNKLIAPDTESSLGGGSASTAEQNQEDEAEDGPVRVDLDRLGKTDGGMIIKGRTSSNI